MRIEEHPPVAQAHALGAPAEFLALHLRDLEIAVVDTGNCHRVVLLSARPARMEYATRCFRFRLIAVLIAMRYSQVKNWESPLKLSSDW